MTTLKNGNEKYSYNMRVQKALSYCGIMSRRNAEDVIMAQRVKVNGKIATIGMSINLNKDKLELDNTLIKTGIKNDKIYIMLNKPRGYVSSLKDKNNRKLASNLLTDVKNRVYNVGRLDKDSEGLLCFTNDGNFANLIMHPKNKIPKTYKVTVKPIPTETQLIKLSSKFIIDDMETTPAVIHVLQEHDGKAVLNVTITQGKNRQIRNMCKLVNLNIQRLKRISVGTLKLGMLQTGKYRYLTKAEVQSLLKSAKR